MMGIITIITRPVIPVCFVVGVPVGRLEPGQVLV